jgi:hypothetical protein
MVDFGRVVWAVQNGGADYDGLLMNTRAGSDWESGWTRKGNWRRIWVMSIPTVILFKTERKSVGRWIFRQPAAFTAVAEGWLV